MRSEWDEMIERFLPICRMDRSAEAFLFDPASLKGSTRHSFPEFLHWLQIPRETIPSDHIFIHTGLKTPAKIEEWTNVQTGEKQLFVYIQNELYISLQAVSAALAHECTHLFLIRKGLQHLHRKPAEEPLHPVSFPGVPSTLMSPRDEKETDVAAFALGFGKLILNGVCDYGRRKPNAVLGYLGGVEAYADVYRRVNDIVGVPEGIARAGLLPEALARHA